MPHRKEHLITTPELLDEFCRHLAECDIVGLDTEFVGEHTYVPEIGLIQLATPKRLVLVDPLAFDDLTRLWELLSAPERLIIVHAGREEIRICQRGCGRAPARLVDLQLAAGLVGMTYPISHGALIQQVLGNKVNKGDTLTDWLKRPLTASQIQYAYNDVRYLLPIWEKLEAQLSNLGRLPWLDEESATLIRKSLGGEEVAVERWRKLSGIGSLDRKKLAVVKALFEWREVRALALNRPARSVVRDDLLIEIAKRSPKSPDDLEVLRGVQKREVSELFRIVQLAKTMPVEDHPKATFRDVETPQSAVLTSMLQVSLASLCLREQIAPALVGATADYKCLTRTAIAGKPPARSNPLSQGWRSRVILPELLAVLEGKRSLRVVDAQAASPVVME